MSRIDINYIIGRVTEIAEQKAKAYELTFDNPRELGKYKPGINIHHDDERRKLQRKYKKYIRNFAIDYNDRIVLARSDDEVQRLFLEFKNMEFPLKESLALINEKAPK